MLDELWLFVIGATGAWAVWTGRSLLTLAVALALLVSASLLFWRRYSLEGVGYTRRLASDRAAFDESVELKIELTNLKPLPLTWLQIEDMVPRRLTIEGGTVLQGPSDFFQFLTIVVAMLPYERIIRRLKVRCVRRGEHVFGPASLESGDYLGTLTKYGTLGNTDRLIVYPKIFRIEVGRLPSNQILGRDAARRSYLTDPIRTIGARDYTHGDPYRLIDWRATARLAKLMVRILEPSTTPILDIVVNIRTPGAERYNYEPDDLEFVLSVTASLAGYGLEKGWAVGLRGNGTSAGSPIAIPASAGPLQFKEILECVTRANTIPSCSVAKLLATPDKSVKSGATLLLVTAILDPELLLAMRDLRRRGRAILIALVARPETTAPSLPFPIIRIDYDEHWSQRETLVLGR
jgi:uncharacterized protein (DUF58 family)